MLSLPWQPPKQIRIVEENKGCYTLSFISKIKNENEFKRIIQDYLVDCLEEHDKLMNSNWENKSIQLRTKDIKAFKQKLFFSSIVIKNK